jgi:phytoene dehydrogenase-like protein
MPEDILSSSWDIVVVGGGPGGLSAAVNAAVRNKKVLLLEHQGQQLSGAAGDHRQRSGCRLYRAFQKLQHTRP